MLTNVDGILLNEWINELILLYYRRLSKIASLIVSTEGQKAFKCSQRLSFRQFVRRYFVAELGDWQNVQACLDTIAAAAVDVDATTGRRPKAIGKDKAKTHTYTVDPMDDTRKQEAEN